MREHDWELPHNTGIRLCARKGCDAEWAVDPVVKGRPYWRHDANGWCKTPGECLGEDKVKP